MRHVRSVLGRFRPVGVVRLLVAAQLIFVLVGLGVWRLDSAARPELPESARPLPDDRVPLPATLEGSYNLALARALEWDRRPRLVSVSEQVFWPQDPALSGARTTPTGGTLIYLFAGERDETYTVAVERGGGTIVEERVVSWEHPPSGEDWEPFGFPVTSDAALRAADAVEGAAFRRACPEERFQTWLTLTRTGAGEPVWRVTYRDERDRQTNALTVDVATSTVRVVKVVRQEMPPCGEPAP